MLTEHMRRRGLHEAAPMNNWEQQWLRHARELIDDTKHRRRCDSLLGPEAADRMDAPDLRCRPSRNSLARPSNNSLVARGVRSTGSSLEWPGVAG